MGSDSATPRQFWVPARESNLKRNLVGHDDDSGIYALVLRVRQPRWVVAGRLGRCRLAAGWYVYVGSAKRNLAARLARHLRHEKRTHWHIDYLRAVARVEQIWLWPWAEKAECRTNDGIQALSGASGPWKGFGSSDCRCLAHLTHFDAEPAVRGMDTPGRFVTHRGPTGDRQVRQLTPRGKGRILASAQ
jgi:Uri superfamily endonuclease